MVSTSFHEAELGKAVANRLREAGYSPVQVVPRLPGDDTFRPDVIAWGADDNGELVPRVAVEVKVSGRPEPCLPLLARVRDTLGTSDHYVVIGEDWYAAEPGLRSLELIAGPAPADQTEGTVADPSVAADLMVQKVWISANENRGRAEIGVQHFRDALSTSAEVPGITTASGDFVFVKPEAFWKASRRVFADFALRAGIHVGVFATPPVITHAMAGLLGNRLHGMVLDPFCGSGETLWAAMDRAVAEDRNITGVGIDVNVVISDVARQIAGTAPMPASIQTVDAFEVSVPSADAVVSTPPFGLRLRKPYMLMNGDVTKQGDLATVDLCLRSLKPGGRAVLQISPGLTYLNGAGSFRDYLASEFRIAALIGCPTGSAFGTQIKTVLMVVDRAPAGETFVAQLNEDWETQLAPKGAALSAALAHIDGPKG